MQTLNRALVVMTILVLPSATLGWADESEENTVIESGSHVTLHYTLKLDDGRVVDSTEDRDPLEYDHGSNRLLPAFEQALEGLAEGDQKEITLEPEEAYGPVNPEAFSKVPLDAVPEELRRVDMMLMARDGEGNEQPVRVHQVEEDHVVLDWNHPLAGETLHFELKVMEVEAGNGSPEAAEGEAPTADDSE